MQIRKISLFEKMLLLISILIIFIGYFFVYGLVAKNGLTMESLQLIFVWLILILITILTSVNENMKEELKIFLMNQSTEIRLLREDLRRKR